MRADHRLGLLPSILSSSNASLILLLAGVLLGLLLAIAPMRATTQQMWDFYTGKPLHALPGMTGWFLVLLVAAFAISPWAYIAWIFFWVTLQLALLCARASAWPYRELANTDTSTDDYYSIDGDLDPDTGTPRVYKRNKHMALRRRLFALNYRYIVVLALPITFLGLMLARLLKWTRVLGNAGDVLENILNLLLSSLLGDVVDYAMDAAQASRIRHVVQADLMLFHDRADVSSLHVFAHSQGTPITFETLFHYLPAEYRRKITTYVTIGSVLSYYHQANPVLDPVYVGRFPVRPYPDFADGFHWLNFWNLVDPITEFYGLDEYHMVQAAPLLELDPDGEPNWQSDGAHNGQANRSYTASPINIKTPATVLNHSEYWSDIPLVQLPFAQRVLGDLQPPVWNPDKLKHLPRFLSHASAVILLGFIWVLLFAPAVWLVNLAWPGGAFRGPFATLIFQSIAGLVPRLPDWLTGVAGWVAEFLAEFAAILVTGAVYFGVIVGLVVGVRFVTNHLVSMWPHRKPKANATALSAHPRS